MFSITLILSNQAIGFSVIATIVILVITLSYLFSKKQRVLRALKKFKFKEITQFRTNELTKVTGKVLHVHEPFVAPYSKRKCVAYEFLIQQKKSTGKSSYWKTLVEEHNIQDFFIEKRGEVAMIKPQKNPDNFKIFMVEDQSVSSGTFNDPTPEFLKVLNDFNIESTSLFGFNKRLRYSERIIEVGETITVGGIAKIKQIDTKIENFNYSQIAVLESSNTQKIIITDLSLIHI